MSPQQSKQLGALVRRRRLKLGIGMRELARRVNIDSRMMQRVEAGELRRPTAKLLQSLADALRLPGEDMLAVAGFSPDALPSLRTYFRTKYDLSEEAVAELDHYLQQLRERYRRDQ